MSRRGGSRIEEKQEEYIERRREIRKRLLELAPPEFEDQNPHADLWGWYAYWRDNLPTYADRRAYVRNLYSPLIAVLEAPVLTTPATQPATKRTYSETVDLADPEVPDWDLAFEVERLLRPYAVGGQVWAEATDSHGEYVAQDVETLRLETEARGETLESLSVSARAPEPATSTDRKLGATQWRVGGSAAFVSSGEEAIFQEVKRRLEDMFAAAAARRPRPPDELEEPLQGAQPSFWANHGARIEKWALALVPVVLGVVLTVLLTAWLIGQD